MVTGEFVYLPRNGTVFPNDAHPRGRSSSNKCAPGHGGRLETESQAAVATRQRR